MRPAFLSGQVRAWAQSSEAVPGRRASGGGLFRVEGAGLLMPQGHFFGLVLQERFSGSCAPHVDQNRSGFRNSSGSDGRAGPPDPTPGSAVGRVGFVNRRPEASGWMRLVGCKEDQETNRTNRRTNPSKLGWMFNSFLRARRSRKSMLLICSRRRFSGLTTSRCVNSSGVFIRDCT